MKTNKAGIDLIKKAEGFKPTCYLCPAKTPTIGFGTTKNLTEADVGKKTITMAEAERLLKEDLARFEADVTRLVTVPINENQFAALVSLAYNIGTGAFAGSTLLRKLNARDYAAAAEQFKVWRKADGRVLQGLINRRKDEETLFRKPVAKASK